jgi:hypothetical protein
MPSISSNKHVALNEFEGNGRNREFEKGVCQRHIIFIELKQIFTIFRPVRDGIIQWISSGYKYLNPDGLLRFFNTFNSFIKYLICLIQSDLPGYLSVINFRNTLPGVGLSSA